MLPLTKSRRQMAVNSGLRACLKKCPEIRVAAALVGTPHRLAKVDGQQLNRVADITSVQPLVIMLTAAPELATEHLISNVLRTVTHTPHRLILHTSYVMQQQSAEPTA